MTDSYLVDVHKCYMVFKVTIILWIIGQLHALPDEDNEQPDYGPGYGEEWFLFEDEAGDTHIMNFSTIPKETQRMILGDAYYYLYTSCNTEAEELEVPEGDELVTSQYFNSSKDIKVITHGWLSSEQSKWLQAMKESYLNQSEYNVITIDWSELAKNPVYPWSALSTRYVGRKTAKLLDGLARTYQVDGTTMHLIGHSLGAQIMAYAGYFSSNIISRITGLDPARPLFELPRMPDEFRLEKSDAEFVDIIHTCAGGYGYRTSQGHADFYPNNGKAMQPGCEGARHVIEACSHGRSYVYFDESIQSDVGFTAYPCESWDKFQKGECKEHGRNMGDPCTTDSRGDYYLYTNNQYQYAKGDN